MRIEVAAAPEQTKKDKGDLLEELAEKFLKTQQYSVSKQVRVTASELDLLCKHLVNNKKIYVECKAHRDTLSSKVLTNLLGTVQYRGYQEGWLISTGPLGKDAKGFKTEWEDKDSDERQKLSIYTPDRVINALTNANSIVERPVESAEDKVDKNQLGEWLLLITKFGIHWLVSCLESGVPTGVIVFNALNGKLIKERKLLQSLSSTDNSYNSLNFEYIFSKLGALEESKSDKDTAVVPVQFGDSLEDYRPAAPEYFIGRRKEQKSVIHLFDAVREDKTETRIFAITGDSGMGKSSLIAKVRNRVRNKYYKKKYFIYAADVRAATNPTYMIKALLACFREAAKLNFGHGDSRKLNISNPADPLSSPSIKEFLQSLEEKNQVVGLVFDQFEELYSKTELFSVFKAMKRLLFSTSSAKANFILGFAWKSDSTVQQDHPAYHMWHELADYRKEIHLKPFSSSEANKTITLYEKEFDINLNQSIRRQIVENSRGFPWLLKKLCIHLFEQLKEGVDQFDLIDKELDVKSLFEKDLKQLNQNEISCLKYVAKNSPADFIETTEVYGHEVVNSLKNKRLLIRSGDRLNIYWDIFREYLLTGDVPSVPMSYLPSSSSLSKLLQVCSLLNRNEYKSFEKLGEKIGLTKKSIGNIIRDLNVFGITKSESSSAILSESIEDNDRKTVLNRIRDVMKRHGLTIELSKLKSGSTVSYSWLKEKLKDINPTANHTEKTWNHYTERMAIWLEVTGFLEKKKDKLLKRESTGINFQALNNYQSSKSTRGFGHIFLGETSPGQTLEGLKWIYENKPVELERLKKEGYRNAYTVLKRFGLVYKSEGKIFLGRSIEVNGKSLIEYLWECTLKEETIIEVAKLIEKEPDISLQEIGSYLNNKYEKGWSENSEKRVGQGLNQWAKWVNKKNNDGEIPHLPRSGSGSNFNSPVFMATEKPGKVLKCLEIVIQEQELSKEKLYDDDYRSAITILRRFELITDLGNKILSDIDQNKDATKILFQKVQKNEALNDIKDFLKRKGNIKNYDVGHYVNKNYIVDWSESTKSALGGTLKYWASWLLLSNRSESLPKPQGYKEKSSQQRFSQDDLFESI